MWPSLSLSLGRNWGPARAWWRESMTPSRLSARRSWRRRQLPSYQQETTTGRRGAWWPPQRLLLPGGQAAGSWGPRTGHPWGQPRGEEECCVLFVFICVLFFMHFWYTIGTLSKSIGQSQNNPRQQFLETATIRPLQCPSQSFANSFTWGNPILSISYKIPLTIPQATDRLSTLANSSKKVNRKN